MNGVTRILIAGAMSLLPAVATANPLPPTEFPDLEAEIRSVIERGDPDDCGRLPQLLGRHGLSTLRDGTLDLVRANMATLEWCIVEAHRHEPRLDRVLLHEFGARAGDPARAALFNILENRLAIPRVLLSPPGSGDSRESRRERETATRRFIETAEAVSDTRDARAKSVLAGLLDSLVAAPAESLWSEYTEPPSWFVRMSLRRCDNPDAGAVLLTAEDGTRRFARAENEIVSAEIYSHPALGLKRHPIEMPASTLMRFFERLESANHAKAPGMIVEEKTATIYVRFRDGVVAGLHAYSQGWVMYGDNTRVSQKRVPFDDRALATVILGLVEQVKFGADDR